MYMYVIPINSAPNTGIIDCLGPHICTLSTLLTEPSAQHLFVCSFYNPIVNTVLPLLHTYIKI